MHYHDRATQYKTQQMTVRGITDEKDKTIAKMTMMSPITALPLQIRNIPNTFEILYPRPSLSYEVNTQV